MPVFATIFPARMALAAGLAFAGTVAGHAAALTDSAERTVEIPADLAAVVPAGAPAQVLLHALAPAKLAGVVEGFGPCQAVYLDRHIAGLPQIPMLTRTDAPGDVAAVAALKPGLSVDYGDVSARYVAADEKIQEELKVPAVIFGGRLAASGSVASALGRALGAEERGDAVSALAHDILGEVKPVGDLPDSDRVAVYIARGADGLQAARAGTSFDEPVRLAGGRNVVTGGGGTFKRMQVEDVVALKPSVVIFASKEALSSPLHDALPKGTRFVLDAGEPYKVILGPPSLNRLAGLAALAPILHPDKVKSRDAGRVEASLFAIPAGTPIPAPLQVQP